MNPFKRKEYKRSGILNVPLKFDKNSRKTFMLKKAYDEENYFNLKKLV